MKVITELSLPPHLSSRYATYRWRPSRPIAGENRLPTNLPSYLPTYIPLPTTCAFHHHPGAITTDDKSHSTKLYNTNDEELLPLCTPPWLVKPRVPHSRPVWRHTPTWNIDKTYALDRKTLMYVVGDQLPRNIVAALTNPEWHLDAMDPFTPSCMTL